MNYYLKHCAAFGKPIKPIYINQIWVGLFMSGATKPKLSAEKVMKLIDHTILFAYTEEKQVDALVKDAARLGTYSVCVLPEYAAHAKELIDENKYDLKLAVVADFPFGAKTTAQRRDEIRALRGVADEIDIVVQIGLVKSGKFGDVARDIAEIVNEAHAGGMKLKVIIETAYLTTQEKERVSEIVIGSGADFIKTSTGFADKDYTASIGNESVGATVADVALMASVAERLGKKEVGIKASGKVRTAQQVFDLLTASKRPADPDYFRVGASATEAIYKELQ